ncbi:MAG: hypothetical protein KDB71_07110 [Mycobacterium sp.]|nr:hypothetical protein [Mycobacterium sp.]
MSDETTTEATTVDTAADQTSPPVDSPGDDQGGSAPQQHEPDTFPRTYVEELRQENGRYRQRAAQADTYAQRLHTELVRATGRLADPTDLPFDAEHLEDGDKLSLALDDLLARKPHLSNRKPVGDIGQGAAPSAGTVDLAAILRGRAG